MKLIYLWWIITISILIGLVIGYFIGAYQVSYYVGNNIRELCRLMINATV